MPLNIPEEITMYGAHWCSDCVRAKKFFGDHRIQYRYIDIDEHPESVDMIKRINNGMRIIPTILFPDGNILAEPSNAELAEQLGLKTRAQHTFYDVIVIGAGPTGLTAATYLGREGKRTLVIDKSGIGGQVAITQVLDNFPGFDEGISGPEFAARLGRQAERFGAEIVGAQEVTALSRDGQSWRIETADGTEYGARALLIATGARYRKLNIPGEDAFVGSNIHFCATCDGAFYRGKHVLVVGGGNSGFEEGLFLTNFADRVDIVEYQPEVRASAILQEQVAALDKMRVTVNHEVEAFHGNGELESIRVRNRGTGEIQEWHYDGVFIFIGLTPNSELVEHLVESENGFIVTDETLMSSEPGLFAAGDVRLGSTKQAASAAGEGATAALMIRHYLNEQKP